MWFTLNAAGSSSVRDLVEQARSNNHRLIWTAGILLRIRCSPLDTPRMLTTEADHNDIRIWPTWGDRGSGSSPGQRRWPTTRTSLTSEGSVPSIPWRRRAPCPPRAQTRRKPGTLSCSQTTRKPALTRKAAVGRCPRNDLLSGRSKVRILLGAPSLS
jgi:hypothetical protein